MPPRPSIRTMRNRDSSTVPVGNASCAGAPSGSVPSVSGGDTTSVGDLASILRSGGMRTSRGGPDSTTRGGPGHVERRMNHEKKSYFEGAGNAQLRLYTSEAVRVMGEARGKGRGEGEVAPAADPRG